MLHELQQLQLYTDIPVLSQQQVLEVLASLQPSHQCCCHTKTTLKQVPELFPVLFCSLPILLPGLSLSILYSSMQSNNCACAGVSHKPLEQHFSCRLDILQKSNQHTFAGGGMTLLLSTPHRIV